MLDAQDKQAVPIKQQAALDYVGAVEEAMVGAFPFTVPADYANLPQLKVGGSVGGAGVCVGCFLAWGAQVSAIYMHVLLLQLLMLLLQY